MSSSRLRIIIVASVIILAIVLFFAPSQVNVKPGENAKGDLKETPGGFNGDDLLASAEKALDSNAVQQLEQLKTVLKLKGEQDTLILDSIGRFWDKQSIPAASAVWFEKKAKVLKTERSYLDAGYRYFDAFRAAQDSGLKDMMVQKAIANYSKVIELNPSNLDAKTDLGACYADGTADPMKGIMLLREVVEANPNHETAQFNLGMLSVKSGQMQKAVDRFKKVLEINPQHLDMYLFLGQIYLQLGDTANALKNYDSFTKKSDDYRAVAEVGGLMKDLKKNVR